MNRILFFMIILISLSGIGAGQNANVYLPDSTEWRVTIDDSLVLSANQPKIFLPAGKYKLLFQPVNSRNWMMTTRQSEMIIDGNREVNVLTYKPEFEKSLLSDDDPKFDNSKFSYHAQLKSNKRKKYIRPILLGTAIASNWASFYIKRKADDYYDIYTGTSDLSKMDKYYDRAADYDVYANIMLGVSAAALTAYMYYIMTD